MSALAKPMVHTTAAVVNPSSMVNIENVVHISTADRIGGRPGNTPSGYLIVFTYIDPVTGGNYTETWEFALEATRDTKYAALIALVSAAV